jgi:hypothetical protein
VSGPKSLVSEENREARSGLALIRSEAPKFSESSASGYNSYEPLEVE